MAVGIPPPEEASNQSQLHQDFWDRQLPQEALQELHCHDVYSNVTDLLNGGCNATWDHVSCWPPTPGGVTAVQPCFASLRGVLYDTSQNVTRLCLIGGTWAAKSDYTHCKPLVTEDEEPQVLWEVEEASTVYYIGYGMSLVALIVALWIFLYFKDLHCVRNTIHVNLLVTFTLIDLTWIVTATLQSSPFGESYKVSCVLVIFLTYLMGTNFFWMFVEGLYLYIKVVKTFSVEHLRFCIYALIGWGAPGIFIVGWATVKAIYSNNSDDPLAKKGCPWQNRDNYDYIFVCPIIAVLLVNIYFLCQIMWVLITKLRAANTLESKQYRKAAKALLVLIPLLGVTHVIVLWSPSHRTARVVFAYLQAALLSTQGLYVAVLYCFLNGEVRVSLRQHLERWKTRRNLSRQQHGHRNSLSYRYSLPGVARERRRSSQSRSVTSCLLLSTSGGHMTTSGGQMSSSCDPLSTSSGRLHETKPGDQITASVGLLITSGDQMSTSGGLLITSGDQMTTSGGILITPGDQITTSGSLLITACDDRPNSGGLMTTSGDLSFTSGGKVANHKNGRSVWNGGSKYESVPTSLDEENVLKNFDLDTSLADTSSVVTTNSVL